jgi:hypothetical protein
MLSSEKLQMTEESDKKIRLEAIAAQYTLIVDANRKNIEKLMSGIERFYDNASLVSTKKSERLIVNAKLNSFLTDGKHTAIHLTPYEGCRIRTVDLKTNKIKLTRATNEYQFLELGNTLYKVDYRAPEKK